MKGSLIKISSDSAALVVWTTGKIARVWVDGNYQTVNIPGRWKQTYRSVRPIAPGDRVSLTHTAGTVSISELMPRVNEFTRKQAGLRPLPQTIAANLDDCYIIASCTDPVTPFGFVDRMLMTSALGGVPATLVINKVDLANPDILQSWEDNYRTAFDVILFTSARNGSGIERLESAMLGKTVLFAGSSGVGKSSLAMAINPNLDLKVRDVSTVTGKGRHTTSTSILYPVENGGWITDTPGLRECSPWNMTAENLTLGFPEIARLEEECKFRNCRHHHEIGCAVKEAMGSSRLPTERYRSYLKLLAEAGQAVRY